MQILLGADHGGFEIKEAIKAHLLKQGRPVEDLGCTDTTSVDYPDLAHEVASRVSRQEVDNGILVCTSGIGMSIAANKYPRVRAALCNTPDLARVSRLHNRANIVALGAAALTPDEACAIVDTFLETPNDAIEDRHERRVNKVASQAERANEAPAVFDTDPETFAILEDEIVREQDTINLIASENHCSPAVRQAQGSLMTNKYAEGYPGKRWYNGCECVDRVESLAMARAKALFGAEHANVQPHCGSSANMAVYFAVLDPGDTIMAMSLAHGGHLTHGHDINFSGRLFNIVSYGVDPETEALDYDAIIALAKEHRPKLIVAGASAYSRILDFARFREAADSVGAMLMVDMAHIAGLVAAGAHPNPVPYADLVTTTTHKTLRGPRGGMVLCREPYAAAIDKQVFPGLQGGPLMHTIAAKAVCFHEAADSAFKDYGARVVENAIEMANVLQDAGFRIVSGGTENHLMLLDVTSKGLTGKDAALALDKAGIVVNKNAIPFDSKSPFVTSGIRIGTAAVTTRGMGKKEMRKIARLMIEVLEDIGNDALQRATRARAKALCAKFPTP